MNGPLDVDRTSYSLSKYVWTKSIAPLRLIDRGSVE